MIDVVYDACVLFSASLRDLLMHLAASSEFTPHWSDTIHEEWIRAVLAYRPGMHRAQLDRTRNLMNIKIAGGLVTGFEYLIPSLTLPDENDRHVLALAIHTKSTMIVTHNLRDFPVSTLEPYGIEAVSPDEFLCRLLEDDPKTTISNMSIHRNSLHRPAKTVDEYLATLEKQGLHRTVTLLRQHLADL
jgi:predicted nucleic acid-binding protein